MTQDQALLWTDGRYHLQAAEELDQTQWTLMRQGARPITLNCSLAMMFHIGLEGVPSPEEWLGSNCPRGAAIGFDPTLVSHSKFVQFSKVRMLPYFLLGK